MSPTEDISGLVSVGMPVYNMVSTVERSVRSVLDQDYPNLELVVCDNHSTDGSYETLCALATEDSRIKLYRQATLVPAIVNTNAALEKSSGDYFMITAADDYLHPSHIGGLACVLRENLDIGVVMSATEVVNKEGKRISLWEYACGDISHSGSLYGTFTRVIEQRKNKGKKKRYSWSYKLNMYYFGLHRMALRKRTIPFMRSVASNDRIYVAYLALITKFGYVSAPTFQRLVYTTSFSKRHGVSIGLLGQLLSNIKTGAIGMWVGLRLLVSSDIPLARKMVVPLAMARLIFAISRIRYK